MNTFFARFWKMVISSIFAVSVLVSAVAWANSVDNTAKQALRIGEENKTKIEALVQQLNAQTNSLTELRVDIKYLINSVNELKAQRR